MGKFFKSKLNIVLLILLLVIIGVGIFFALKLFKPKTTYVNAADFTGYTENEVINWAEVNGVGSDKFIFTHEYNDEVPKSQVIYQSIKVGDPITETVSIVISDGPNPDRTVEITETFTGKTIGDVQKWFTEQGFTNVSTTSENSDTVEKDCVIRVNVSGSAKISDMIVITYSLGKKIDNNPTDDTKLVVPDDYIGLSEADFIAKIKALNLNPVKQDKTYKSKGMKTGTVYAYDSTSDGKTFKAGDDVKYYLVDNSETPTTEEVTVPNTLVGLKEADFKTKIEALGLVPNKKSEHKTTVTNMVGTIYSYVDSVDDKHVYHKGDTVDYVLNVSESSSSDVVTVPANLLYKTEAEFKSAIEALGLVPSKSSTTHATTKQSYDGTVYSYKDSTEQTYHKGDTVTYILYSYSSGSSGSSGSSSQSSTSDTVTVPTTLCGLTEAEFKTKIESLGLTATKSSTTHSTTNSSYDGKVYSYPDSTEQTYKKGDTVTYILYKYEAAAEKTAQVASINVLSAYEKTSFNDTKNALASYFKDFTNVTYTGVSSTQGVGTIVSIYVNGVKNATGTFPVSAAITINICNQQAN